MGESPSSKDRHRMSIAESIKLEDAAQRITVLESQVAELTKRLVALEKNAVSDNTLHLRDKKRG